MLLKEVEVEVQEKLSENVLTVKTEKFAREKLIEKLFMGVINGEITVVSFLSGNQKKKLKRKKFNI